MYVLYGTYVLLESMCYGVLGPNMWRFNSYVRDGMLDFVLTKPVNSQFFASTRYLDLNGVANTMVGVAVIGYGLRLTGHAPDFPAFLGWLLTMTCGLVMAYALWFVIVTLTVWTVRMDAAGAAFEPVLQLARMPINIYPQRMQMMLTFALPVAFLTTIPASFLLGRGQPVWLGMAVAGAALFLGLSSRFWSFALRHYGSASS
jgi:ABC-2 type transport system permease protein